MIFKIFKENTLPNLVIVKLRKICIFTMIAIRARNKLKKITLKSWET